MVDTAAGIVHTVEIADFHLVEAAASGLHAEGAEKRLCRLQRLDGKDFSAAAPAAQRDLVLVGGQPPLQGRRPIEHPVGHRVRAFLSLLLSTGAAHVCSANHPPNAAKTLGGVCARSIAAPRADVESLWKCCSSAASSGSALGWTAGRLPCIVEAKNLVAAEKNQESNLKIIGRRP